MEPIKITRRLLGDYRKLKKEALIQELELREMEEGDMGIGNSTILDYRSGKGVPQAVVGFDWDLYDRRIQELEQKKAKIQAIEQWIENIEDVQTRYIFRMFYLENKNWIQIADKTGYGGNADYVRLCIRDAYLKKQKIR